MIKFHKIKTILDLGIKKRITVEGELVIDKSVEIDWAKFLEEWKRLVEDEKIMPEIIHPTSPYILPESPWSPITTPVVPYQPYAPTTAPIDFPQLRPTWTGDNVIYGEWNGTTNYVNISAQNFSNIKNSQLYVN